MNSALLRLAATLVSGVVFGFGLSLSGMLDPARVRAFLDITGNWNPSLAFVLGGAVFVSALGVLVTRRLKHPLFDGTFHLPNNQVMGPALASLSLGLPATVLFVVAMLAGMLVHDRLVDRKLPRQTSAGAGADTGLSQPR
jgi:uncharacterized protein